MSQLWYSLQEFNPEANHTGEFGTLTVGVDTKSIGMAKVLPCIAGQSAQKVGRWALSCHYLTNPFHIDEPIVRGNSSLRFVLICIEKYSCLRH